jgi:hypothetical protein
MEKQPGHSSAAADQARLNLSVQAAEADKAGSTPPLSQFVKPIVLDLEDELALTKRTPEGEGPWGSNLREDLLAAHKYYSWKQICDATDDAVDKDPTPAFKISPTTWNGNPNAIELEQLDGKVFETFLFDLNMKVPA